MLVFQDAQARERQTPPAFLAGAVDLLQVEDRKGLHRWWGIGNAHLVGPDGKEFRELSDGWSVAITGLINPADYRRDIRWASCADAEDTRGRAWRAPRILSEGGERIILVTYGRDFLPTMTPEQARAVEVASAARLAVLSAMESGGVVDFSLGARWAAELLAITHHLSVECLAVIGVLDEQLILAVLSVSCGLPLKRVDP